MKIVETILSSYRAYIDFKVELEAVYIWFPGITEKIIFRNGENGTIKIDLPVRKDTPIRLSLERGIFL